MCWFFEVIQGIFKNSQIIFLDQKIVKKLSILFETGIMKHSQKFEASISCQSLWSLQINHFFIVPISKFHSSSSKEKFELKIRSFLTLKNLT